MPSKRGQAIPDGHPRLLFKHGTSLSKAFGLIKRFSRRLLTLSIVMILASKASVLRP